MIMDYFATIVQLSENLTIAEDFPIWYIVNDSFIALFSIITVLIGLTFVLLVLRKRKLHTIVNLLSSNCCLCGSLLAVTIIWDAFYMLKADISGLAREDRCCVVRNICMLTAMLALNYSLCIQTYHRFVSIVYSQQPALRSVSLYRKMIVIQWLLCPFLVLPIILNGQIVYQPGSFICQTSFSNKTGFFYLSLVSYAIPILFILILHILILRYLKKNWRIHRKQRLTGLHVGYPLQRITLTTIILIISYLPYGVFFLLEYLRMSVLPYAQKLAMIFAAISFASTMTFILGFNRNVRNSCYFTRNRTERAIIKHIIYKSAKKFPKQVFF